MAEKNLELKEIDLKIEAIKGVIDELESKAVTPESFGILGREELLRAKGAYDRFTLQQKEYLDITSLGRQDQTKALEEIIKTRVFKSEAEKELFCKVFRHNNKPKEVAIIPIPLKSVKRIIINGKPYVEFKESGAAVVMDDVGTLKDD